MPMGGGALAGEVEVLDRSRWSMRLPGRLTPQEGQPVSIVQEAGKATRQVWTDAENLFPAGARTPNRPVHSDYVNPALSDALAKSLLSS